MNIFRALVNDYSKLKLIKNYTIFGIFFRKYENYIIFYNIIYFDTKNLNIKMIKVNIEKRIINIQKDL